MEEILASIRRIIADDTETTKDEPAAGADLDSVAAAVIAAARSGGSDPDDDVLDLAEIAQSRHGSEAEPRAEPEAFRPEAFSPEPAWEESPAPEPQPMAFVPRAPAPPTLPPPALRPAPPPERETALPPERHPAPGASLAAGMAEAIVSSETTASVGQAFNLLSHTILSQNAITLEDIVREMLKPMLRVWLDDNLPPMVERLVRAEIERVARGSR